MVGLPGLPLPDSYMLRLIRSAKTLVDPHLHVAPLRDRVLFCQLQRALDDVQGSSVS